MNTIVKVVVIVGALALGVGGGFLAARAMPERIANDQGSPALPDFRPGMPGWEGRPGGGRFDKDEYPRYGMGPGMMVPGGRVSPDGRMSPGQPRSYEKLERISLEDAVDKAREYVARVSDELRAAEVMEFEENFYVVVEESASGKGAFELLVDPYSGRVMLEFGPTRMWNAKYGHMRGATGASAENTLSMEEASALAQKALSDWNPDALVSQDGIEFYGYYSFDYELDGEVAGMLSVNGQDGEVWFHNWHGDFIREKEIEE